MHTLETVSEGSWGRPRRLYPESVITNYQEKALRRSLSLLLLAGANALHASHHLHLHLHQSSAVAYQLSPSPFLSLSLYHLLSLPFLSLSLSLSLLPLSTPLYLLQLYHHLVFFNFISWRQKKNGFIFSVFYRRLQKIQAWSLKVKTDFFRVIQFFVFSYIFFSLMARLAHCGLTETWCFRI